MSSTTFPSRGQTESTVKHTATAAAFALAMVLTAGAAHYVRPTVYLADTRPVLKIEPSLPQSFGGWRQVHVSGGVVNPQAADLLNILYSELISRTYVNERGDRVMLSIAYGKNQNDSFQVHKPEICYPAQGFQVKSNTPGYLSTAFGNIPVRRLETFYGHNRPEPVTYWTTLGDQAVEPGLDKKIKEMRYAMKGYIADGLLFRISTVDPDSERAFEVHKSFVEALLGSLSTAERRRLAGLVG